MISSITKSLIESVAYADNYDFSDEIENRIFNLISLSIAELEKNLPYVSVSNCIIQPISENFTKTYIPGSDFVYFLGIASPQLEINSMTYSNTWNRFKKRFKDAWIDSSRRLKKRREKAKKLGITEEKEINEDNDKYTFENFLEDFQHALTKNLTQTSIVYRGPSSVRIVGKDDFGVNTNVIIYPTILEGKNYKKFISKKKGYDIYNFEHRENCFLEKFNRVGTNYIFMLKIMNYLMRENTKQPVNQIFLESLLYGCPDTFFEGNNIYSCFIKIINYLRFSDVSDYKSVLTEGKTIFDDKGTMNASYQYSSYSSSYQVYGQQ
jgi:hypothetical protein